MRRPFIIFALFLLATTNIFSRDLQKKAEENPLDCAFYALSQDKNAPSHKIDALAKVFFDLRHFDALLYTIDLADGNYSKLHFLLRYSFESIKNGNNILANRLLNRAMHLLRTTDDEDEWDHDSAGSISERLAVDLALMNRFTDVFEIISHQSENEYQVKLLVSVAETLSRDQKNEKSLKILKEISKFEESSKDLDTTIKIAEIYARLGSNENAFALLKKLENDISTESNQNYRSRDFFNLIPIYLKIGQTELALTLWNQNRDPENSSDTYFLASQLIENGHAEKAKPYLLEIEEDKESPKMFRAFLVETYLKFNDIVSASKIAKTTFLDDDYHQQRALMILTDRFTLDGETEKALDILDFAFQKAVKVGEEHLPEHSIGASPLTRKVIYLRNIRDRYFKLRQFDRGLAIVNSFKSNDSRAKEFYALSIIEYVRQQASKIARKKASELLSRAENFVDEDDDYQLTRIRLATAEVYAKLGEKSKAVQTLTKILETIEIDDEELILVGKVFAANNLKSDAKMRTVLRRLVEEAE